MNDCKMNINELVIVDNKLHISASINYPLKTDAFSPKVKVFFECEEYTRRLPFKIVEIKQNKDGRCVLLCRYSFNLDFIFYNLKSNKDITVRIDFYYGDIRVEGSPFTVSTNAFTSEYGNGVDSDFKINVNTESNRIIIKRKRQLKKNIISRVVFKTIYALIKFLSFIFKTIFTICLLPYFVFDGFFAGIGILSERYTRERLSVLKNIFVQIKLNISSFLKTSLKKTVVINNLQDFLFFPFRVYYNIIRKKPVIGNRITFMSGRRDKIGGNSEFVYNIIKDRKDIDFQFLLFSDPNGHMKVKNIVKFLKLYASSKIVIVDDYFRLLNIVNKREEVKLFQLWHACGAFKTFGFTRLGKVGGPLQVSLNHRMYDYAIVSSKIIAPHYAEGFGLSDRSIVATGIPRTDVFMDENYKNNAVSNFYAKYPQLKDKKIILFAPTFRGNGQMTAYYQTNVFHPSKLYEALDQEYAILIKMHPFCKERFKIPKKYKDYIIDVSAGDELNDLLFVTDLLITDYSSVIFEASLLNIPMLFYAYDLYDYVSSRDFYYDFESFVPGKIAFTEKELVECIKNKDFKDEKIEEFRNKFFDNLDGKSSKRVADLIIKCLNE